MSPIIKVFWFNPFRECTYVVSDENGSAFVVDAGCSTLAEQERLKQYIGERNLLVKAHLLTHAHLDHLLGARFLYENYGVLPHLHAADAFLFNRQEMQSAAFGCPLSDEPLTQFLPINDSDILTMGTMSLQVIHTPGHSAGSVCYYLGDSSQPVLFSGDTLFAGGVGRTDLPGGNAESLRSSLQSKLFVLPADTVVYPGHGLDTTVGTEKQNRIIF
ncbi:MAG TPA: MBL fold hydrolase [Bacteroidales bacterium]|nr:MBL fold hydrolase [Bacteroidales bacterium]